MESKGDQQLDDTDWDAPPSGSHRPTPSDQYGESKILTDSIETPEISEGIHDDFDPREKHFTLAFIRSTSETGDGGGRILLGMKKRGFGAGRWNGFGGKVSFLKLPE